MPSLHPPDEKNGDSKPYALPELKPGASAATKSNAIEIPQITLPKGGGALKGIDEKFEVNAANGTASFSIPLPLSPGRNGFQPALALSYNSGAGNGLFGLGWDLSFPSIQRKTDKRLPRYRNYEDSDTFMFTGVEDLVPALKKNANGGWEKDEFKKGNYTIRRYRPRIEGAFSPIERIWKKNEPSFYWKVTTRDNVVTYFGKSASHRIADPEHPERVFRWLPELSFDDKGDCIIFGFKAENLDNVSNDPHEYNRREGKAKFANRHLKWVKYGNVDSFYPQYKAADGREQWKEIYETPAPGGEFLFRVVFDYGDHDEGKPAPEGKPGWPVPARRDAFSDCRAGFEIRTYRQCKRVLMFHRFTENEFWQNGEPGRFDYLVRSMDFKYEPSTAHPGNLTEVSYLTEITQTGYVWNPDGSKHWKSLPALTFSYQQLRWNKEIREVSPDNRIHAPAGLGNGYQWTDFYGEGIAGIFTEQADGWYYKENLGNGAFAPAKAVLPKPSFTGLADGVLQLQDLEADGRKQIVVNSPGLQGYYELTDENDWEPFRAFARTANVDLRDPNIRLLDLNGDGQPEIVLSEERAFTWYPAAGTQGYDAPELAPKPFDEERGPALVFAEPLQTIFLADMSGDGLTDLVRIRNGEVCYWPNLGYGRFGARVTMSHAPLFDTPDQFNPAYIHLADVSGTGATDLLYLGQDRFRAWLNLSGNGWSAPVELDPFPQTAPPGKLDVVDFLGQGTSCIVWSSPLPGQPPLRYIDLMGGVKPHIMTEQRNGMGKVTRVTYKSSTHFYLEDKKAGMPWMTKLPFPVQCVEKVEVEDEVANLKFTNTYTYHHGYFDHAEREFRGFGRVEQKDTENYDRTTDASDGGLNQPPVLTKTWFHTGAAISPASFLRHYEPEFWYNRTGFPVDADETLPDAVLTDETGNILPPGEIPGDQWLEALRACKGMVLRQEVFAEDGTDEAPYPYSVATHNCHVRRLQPRQGNPYAVFLTVESEAMTWHYERRLSPPEKKGDPWTADPRVAHSLNLRVDDLGNVLESASVVYGRQAPEKVEFPPEMRDAAAQAALVDSKQRERHIVVTVNDFTTNEEHVCSPWVYRPRLPYQTKTYELTEAEPESGEAPKKRRLQPRGRWFSPEELRNAFSEAGIRPYEGTALKGLQKRLIEHIRTLYRKDDLSGPLPDGHHGALGLPWESYQLTFTPGLLEHIYGDKLPPADWQTELGKNGRYEKIDNQNWWISSGKILFGKIEKGKLTQVATLQQARARFFLPDGYEDPFETCSVVRYGPYCLYIEQMEDALENVTSVERFNFRTLAPERIRDLNGNLSEAVSDELGLVAGVAIIGKENETDIRLASGDTLLGFNPFPDKATIDAFFNDPYQEMDTATHRTRAHELLGRATSRLVYDFSTRPARVAAISREKHVLQEAGQLTSLQISIEYTAGLGQVVLKKVQAEPGIGWSVQRLHDGTCKPVPDDTKGKVRWIGNGRAILNNKGNPVKQYEPYFSVTHQYEDEDCVRQFGVTPVLHYDPVGRVIRTDFPDGTFTKVEFTPWEQRVYDQNDTVRDSVWFEKAEKAPNGTPLKKAAFLAGWHHDTPTVLYLDSLGRPFFSVAHNKWRERSNTGYGPYKEAFYTTSVELDIEGNQRAVWDARGNPVMSWKYDMLGRQLFQHSMDAGDRWMLNDCMGKPMLAWDVNEFQETDHAVALEKRVFSTEYDELHRPRAQWLRIGTAPAQMIERFEYADTCDNAPSAKQQNLLGQLVRHYDPAGLLETLRRDFKGNTLEVKRQLSSPYREPLIDWTTTPQTKLENESFIQITEYDGLNRMSRVFNWHKGLNSRVAVYLPEYNERGVLKKEDLVVRARKIKDGYETVKDAPGSKGTRRITAIEQISYNAKGQKELLNLGNGTTTRYHYDPYTFRLTQLCTTLPNHEPDFPQHHSGLKDPSIVQQLHYTYDPVGNVTEIYDEAYEPVFFKNQQTAPRSRYAYDALYRLIEAEGREQYGATGAPPQKPGPAPEVTFPIHQPNDPNGLRNYTQRYTYDSVGNILEMRHIANGGSWTRAYTYDDHSNRLQHTATNNPVSAVDYGYDTHGNMLNYRNTPKQYHLRWDYRDMIRYLNLEGGGQAWYNYDAGKERSRKVIETQAGVIQWERLYLGGLEIYRRYAGSVVVEEIESLHLFEGEQRVLLVDDVLTTDNNQLSTGPLYRYQYGNHLGSVGLELNEDAAIISYEEYHPYGTTAYQATAAGVKSVAKRYRYTGMERDEESGMSYHSARYYLGWLGRWGSVDPLIKINVYAYCKCNPIIFLDKNGMEEGRNHVFDDEVLYGGNPKTSTQAEQLSEEYRLAGNYEAANNYRNRKHSLLAQETKASVRQGINEGMQQAFVVWGLMGISIAGGIAGGVASGAVVAAGGSTLKATLIGSFVSGGVEVGLEQTYRLMLGERLLSEGEVALHVGLSILVPLAFEQLSKGIQKVRSLDSIGDDLAEALAKGLEQGAKEVAGKTGQTLRRNYSILPEQVPIGHHLERTTAEIRKSSTLRKEKIGDVAIGIYEYEGQQGYLVGLSTTNGLHAERQLRMLAEDLKIPGASFHTIYEMA